MFSWFSDITRNYSEYQNPRIRRILWNTAMTYKISTKALSAILEAMKLVRSPPVDSCSEYHPNDYSNLEESKADDRFIIYYIESLLPNHDNKSTQQLGRS